MFVVASAIAWRTFVTPLIRQAQVRERNIESAIEPLVDLKLGHLHNGFGVHSVEFGTWSELKDDNIARLSTLDHFPLEFELTLIISTKEVTDESIDLLAELTRVDSLHVGDSGLTNSGIKDLRAKFPNSVYAGNREE